MTAITLTDLENAKLDVDHIAAISTGTAATATDRLGGIKPTIKGATDSLTAKVAEVESAKATAINTTIPAAVALVDAAVAATAAGSATAAKVAAESARDAAIIGAGVYTTEALGRAAVVDGIAFKVQGAGDVAAYEYRRTNSGASVLIATYPSSAAVAPFDGSYGSRVAASNTRLSLTDGDGFEIVRVGVDGSLLSGTALDLTANHLNTAAFSVQAATEFGINTGFALSDPDGFYSEMSPVTGLAVASAAVASPLKQLRDALSNDLTDVMVRLVGDSITWGMTVTGGGTVDPRSHALTDARNNLTSPSWANLLHKYLGNRRSVGVLTNPAPGVALYTAIHQIDVVRDPKVSLATSSGDAVTKTEYTNAGTLLGIACDVPATQMLTFQITGNNLTVVYAKVSSDATAGFEVFVDGASQGVVSTYNAAASFGNTAIYAVAQGKHEIKIKALGASTVRIEGLRFTRKIRIANDGLIGTNTGEWLPTASLLPASIANDDTFVMCQLGTNDRTSLTAPNDPLITKRNLSAISDYISATRGKPLIMLAANFASPDFPASVGTYYGQADVARMISQLCSEKGHSFIDNYQATLKLNLAGTTFLADGLHPNDTGHLAMFNNIATHIETAL